MTIKDFVRISQHDLERMSAEDLARINKSGASLSNRRLSGLIAAGGSASPSFQGLPKSVREAQRFTVTPNMSKNRIIAQIQAEQSYLKSRYSTGSQWAKVQTSIEKKYGKKYTRYKYTTEGKVVPVAIKFDQPTYTRAQINKFWKVFHKLQEARPELFVSNYAKTEMVEKISNWFYEDRTKSQDNILKDIEEKINAELRKSEKEQQEAIKAIRSGKHKTFHS